MELLNIRSKAKLSQRIAEIVLYFLGISLTSYYFLEYDVSASIEAGILNVVLLMFVINPLNDMWGGWLKKRWDRKRENRS